MLRDTRKRKTGQTPQGRAGVFCWTRDNREEMTGGRGGIKTLERKRIERRKAWRWHPQQGQSLPKPDLVSGPPMSELHSISWIWVPVGLTTMSLTQSAYASLSEFLLLVNNS